MPLLGYNGGLPLDFWDTIQPLFDAMNKFAYYLTAFLAAGSLFRDASHGVQAASSQYLLGLGTADVTG